MSSPLLRSGVFRRHTGSAKLHKEAAAFVSETALVQEGCALPHLQLLPVALKMSGVPLSCRTGLACCEVLGMFAKPSARHPN